MHVNVIKGYLKLVETINYRIGWLQDGSAFRTGRNETTHAARIGRPFICDEQVELVRDHLAVNHCSTVRELSIECKYRKRERGSTCRDVNVWAMKRLLNLVMVPSVAAAVEWGEFPLQLDDSYVRTESSLAVRRLFQEKFPDDRVLNRDTIHKLVNKFREKGSVPDK
ncbi:hypothetical protein ANN_18803 [Periplaneta americana]|uniref:DUF4817 domain-containing protein n=1 Tax=Periplaneta americana TaxID=6978 RepID=A0ABQ8SQI0_PERAM|nr:hypothetical protein ANN_18803 [Periplaneta americana]